MKQKGRALLEIQDLTVSFPEYSHGKEKRELQVLSNLQVSVYPGEVVAVAGSSGSGKSILASAVLGILPEHASVSGQIFYKGEALTPQRQRALRGKEVVLVPQSTAFLDPLMKVGKQADGHGRHRPSEQRRRLFRRLGLPEHTEQLYPFQLSGGMARRVLLTTALLTEAELILADEPTPGMGLEQALEALTMFRELAQQGRGILWITHDIDLAYAFADRVAVFYAGTIVETAPAGDFQTGPEALRHPYSRALWRALPQNGFQPLDGWQPYTGDSREGCLFAPRCPDCTEVCRQKIPPVRELRGGEVRCFYGT